MWFAFAFLGFVVTVVAASGDETRPPGSSSPIPRDPVWDRRMSARQAARRRDLVTRGGPGVGPGVGPGWHAQERFRVVPVRVTLQRQRSLRRRHAPDGYYVLRPGDSFFGAARGFEISIGALQAANPDVNPTRTVPGQRLRIPW